MANKIVKSTLNEGRVSMKGFEDKILNPLSNSLGIKVRKGETKKENQGYASKITSRFYEFGNLDIMVRDTKVPGMGADDVDVWILDADDKSQGRRFHSGWGDYEEFVKTVKEKVSNNAPDRPVRQRQWTQNEVDQLIRTLQSDMQSERLGDDEAFDIARNILDEEDGLINFLNAKGIEDHVGWLADKL